MSAQVKVPDSAFFSQKMSSIKQRNRFTNRKDSRVDFKEQFIDFVKPRPTEATLLKQQFEAQSKQLSTM